MPLLRKETLDAVTRYIRRTPGQALALVASGGTWDDMPTASVRSVGVFHGIGCHVSPWRSGEGRRAEPAVEKDKIVELEHTNSVSMPSALFVEAGTDAVLFAARVGRVKLLRPLTGLLALRADGAS